jgi:hypothetical protein
MAPAAGRATLLDHVWPASVLRYTLETKVAAVVLVFDTARQKAWVQTTPSSSRGGVRKPRVHARGLT